MPKRNEKLLLKDIIQSIENIFEYTRQMSLEEFVEDKKTKML